MDAFGDFLKKLQLVQLLKLGKRNNNSNSDTINYGTVTNIDNNSQMLLEYGDNNDRNDNDIIMDSNSDDNIGAPTDNETESIFSDSDISKKLYEL